MGKSPLILSAAHRLGTQRPPLLSLPNKAPKKSAQICANPRIKPNLSGSLIPPGIASVAAPATAATAIAGAAITTPAATPATVSATAATAAIIVTAAATPSSAAEAALLAGPRFVHTKRAPLDLLAVKLADGILRLGFGSHGDKGESPGFARELILHQQHFGHCAGLRKHILQLELRRRERQVAYIQSISHNGLDFRSRRLTVCRGRYGAEETPMTDPAEPDLFLC